jgi:hypothetical protein
MSATESHCLPALQAGYVGAWCVGSGQHSKQEQLEADVPVSRGLSRGRQFLPEWVLIIDETGDAAYREFSSAAVHILNGGVERETGITAQVRAFR